MEWMAGIPKFRAIVVMIMSGVVSVALLLNGRILASLGFAGFFVLGLLGLLFGLYFDL